LAEAVTIRGLLARNTEELDGVLRALGGEYVLPEAGGDLLRDGAGVLPTGDAPADPGPAPRCVSPRARACLDASRQRAICALAQSCLFGRHTQPGAAARPLRWLCRPCHACITRFCNRCCDAAISSALWQHV
jgi:hypothetical protein